MINIYELSLLDLLPVSIKTDEITAVCKALDKQLMEISGRLIENIILPRIDELPEKTVDLLAWQLHVDFYEPLGMDLKKKRELVKNAVVWHKEKGTKRAVEQLVKTVFFDDFKVIEWFTYGGKPYYFRIVIKNGSVKTKEEYNLLIQAINSAKNIRSHLEKVISESNTENKLYFGMSVKKKHTITVG
ncbi:MAG: phage tail protein I [Clostridiales bacterium]|nr:phage tail protein I [Clostridiales bacterium]